MKINHILFITILFFVATTNAQFTDDMESYTEGEPIIGGHWTDWGCGGGVGCALMSSSAQSNTGNLSGLIPGDNTTDAVLDLGNKIFGTWGIAFWVYIPSGKEAYFTFQQSVPIGTSEPFAHTYFNQDLNNPGVGKVEDTALGTVLFNFPHDEWFRIVLNWDVTLGMGMATWHFNVDTLDVLPLGTPFTNELGDPTASVGGIEFLSISSDNEMYIDDFIYNENNGGCTFGANPFLDDMEYGSGDPLGNWWSEIEITSEQANSGVMSGIIPGDGITDVILDLENNTSNNVDLEFYMYVPSNKEAYWNIQGYVPVNTGEWVVGNFFFNQDNNNPGLGLIDDTHIGDVPFNFPHDEWFPINMKFNISQGMANATWGIFIDDSEVLPEGSPFTNEAGDIPTSLGGINFFSISTDNLYYIDDVNYSEGILSVTDNTKIEVVIYPNPTQSILNIDTQGTIISLRIYNILGNIIEEISGLNSIDISNLSSGIYFIEVSTDTGSSIQKFIKN